MVSRADVKERFLKVAQPSDDGSESVVRYKDIYLLADEFKLDASCRELVQIQGALREMNGRGSIEQDGIHFELWYTWYKQQVSPKVFDNHNELLVRPVIGRVKFPTRNLKQNEFVYGQKNKADKEGAGEVVLNWVAGKLSESKETGVCLMKVNKAALKNKLHTAKEVNKFLQENKTAPHLQRPKVVGRKKARGPLASREVPVRSSERAPREDIRQIIFPSRETEGAAPEHYADISGQVKKGALPSPRQTKCSGLLRDHTAAAKAMKESPHTPWKMSKFTKNAKPKIFVPKE